MPSLPANGEFVYRESHLNARLADFGEFVRFGVIGIAKRIADAYALYSAYANDVAHGRRLGSHAVKSLELINIRHFRADILLGFMVVYKYDRLVLPKRALFDSADADRSDVIGIIECGNKHTHRLVRVARGRGNIADDLLEQRNEVFARGIGIERSRAVTRRTVNDRAVELLFGGVEFHKQFEYFVHDLFYAGVGSVDFVYDDDYTVSEIESLLQHESGLRHRAFVRVHEKDYAVYHFENTLDFAAEISVTRGVDNVDFVVAVLDGSVFRKYGYSALALYVVRVHYALGNDLIRAERSALFEQRVHESGFAVIDVSDYRYVSDVFVSHTF